MWQEGIEDCLMKWERQDEASRDRHKGGKVLK
jgi:hypothetical protein